MKTTINSIAKKASLITIAIFGLGIYSIAATNGPEILMNANAPLIRITQNLSPSTPSEATFEDSDCGNLPCAVFAILTPVTPAEADFEEMNPENTINLLPVTPAYADFNDDIQSMINYSSLAPVTPKEADFTENI